MTYSETDDTIHCLQRAIASLREQLQDLRAEQSEDLAEIKWQLQDLRRNWLCRAREGMRN